jgi:hypothetical protein
MRGPARRPHEIEGKRADAADVGVLDLAERDHVAGAVDGQTEIVGGVARG